MPKYFDRPARPSVDTVLKQQRRLKQGDAKRAQTKPAAIVTKEEKFEAAKAGARNWLLDKAAEGIGQAAGLPLAKEGAAFVLKPLRAPEPSSVVTNVRELEMKENYEGMQMTLTTIELGLSIVAPMVAESALANVAPRVSGLAAETGLEVAQVEGQTTVSTTAKEAATGEASPMASITDQPSGPWIRFSRSEEEANAFERTARQIEGSLPGPPRQLARRWGSQFNNEPLQPGRLPELPQQAGGYYSEYTTYLDPSQRNRGALRTVTGAGGEVYTSWTHYGEAQPFFPIDPNQPLLRPSFLRAR